MRLNQIRTFQAYTEQTISGTSNSPNVDTYFALHPQKCRHTRKNGFRNVINKSNIRFKIPSRAEDDDIGIEVQAKQHKNIPNLNLNLNLSLNLNFNLRIPESSNYQIIE